MSEDKQTPEEPGLGPAEVERSHRGYWLNVEKEHWGAIAWALGALLLLMALGGAAVYAVMPKEQRVVRAPQPAGVIPTETPTPTVVPTTSVEPTPAAVSTPTASSAAIVRAPLFAYRLGGAIWVSGEHGGDQRSVLSAAEGQFALSPDGLSLAVADSLTESMTIVSLLNQQSVRVGSAGAVKPAWAPNSAWLLFARLPGTGENTDVVRVDRDGSNPKVLATGRAYSISNDGKTIVIATGAFAGSGKIAVVDSAGNQREIGPLLAANSLAAARSGAFYAVGSMVDSNGQETDPYIGYIAYKGGATRKVMKRPLSSGAAEFSNLSISPNNAYLAYEESGDDGYSRLFVVKTSGGTPKALSPRRDDYLLGWNATGSEILFVEGNARNDERTKVMAVRPDGTHRRTIIVGGGI